MDARNKRDAAKVPERHVVTTSGGSNAPLGLVIFDCDGVLVDSEPLAMRTLIEAIGRQGITISPEVAYRDYLGRSLGSISQSLADSHGEPLGAAALASMRTDLYALYRRELRATPGIREAIAALNVPFCVASSSSPERVALSLDVTGLRALFGSRLYSATMVARGKPAPDLFLHAAHVLGVEPARCLVIEDSPAGILAARAAGMRVFAYMGGGHVAQAGLRAQVEQLSPDAVFDDMHRLADLVASLGNNKTAS